MVTIEPNDPQSAALLEEVAAQANPTRGKPGRPPTTRRRKAVMRELREGQATSIDRGWLLEQLLGVYQDKGCRAPDKLRALELMSKISGYGQRTDEPEDEKAAIAELMADLDGR